MLSWRALSLAAWVGAAVAKLRVHDASFTPDYVLEVAEQDYKINCEVRRSVAVNGSVPGPEIHLQEGRTTWIRVYNRLQGENLTMHWHGLSQRAAPFSDGTPLVSQWPIAPEHFFDYQIRPEVGDAGTYFYHSHVGLQQSTAHGALIVRNCHTPHHEYHDDVTLLLGDYYNATDGVMQAGLLGDPFKWTGEPHAITVQGFSGKAGFSPEFSSSSSYESESDSGSDSCAPAIIDVHPGKKYRVRVIGATMLSLVKMGIEDHADALQVIEADGADTQPVPIDHIQVASGQRFSFLLQTKSSQELRAANKTHFWIRYESRDRPQVISGYALLRYKLPGAKAEQLPAELPAQSPVILPNETSTYLEYKLHPLLDEEKAEFPRLSEVTRTVVIQVNQQLESGAYVNGKLNGTVVWAENGTPWKENVESAAHQVPYLVEVFNSGHSPNYTLALEHGGFDPTTRAFPAKVGEVIDIVWVSNSGLTGGFDFHPMHMHGKHGWDLGGADGIYNAEANEQEHFQDEVPLRRDTTLLYRYRKSGAPHSTEGWRAWRIRVTEEDVGAWMMHCHIAQHSVMGMNTVWMFGDAEAIRKKFPAVPYVQGYLDFGGDAYGREGRDPHVFHYWEDKLEKEKLDKLKKLKKLNG
ncbi:Multicopper oxidase aurL2 [Claviceps monticola]|nr:Multicopper oxidase aurL2 [Claviceps monticola]